MNTKSPSERIRELTDCAGMNAGVLGIVSYLQEEWEARTQAPSPPPDLDPSWYPMYKEKIRVAICLMSAAERLLCAEPGAPASGETRRELYNAVLDFRRVLRL